MSSAIAITSFGVYGSLLSVASVDAQPQRRAPQRRARAAQIRSDFLCFIIAVPFSSIPDLKKSCHF